MSADIILFDERRPAPRYPANDDVDETLRRAADQRIVDRVLAWVEVQMETTLHRSLAPKDRVTVLRMLSLMEPRQ
jgi:hypothetical protein